MMDATVWRSTGGSCVTAIEFDEPTRTLALTTRNTTYAFRLAGDGVRHVHWGPRLTIEQTAAIEAPAPGWGGTIVGEEYTAEGGARFGPPALIVELPGGVRAVEFAYADHDITSGGCRVGLVDRRFPLRVDLHYRVYPDVDVIERWSTVTHTGSDDPIVVERFDSAVWTIPRRDGYRLSHVTGEWAAEFALERTPLPYGEFTLTTRRGATRHQTNPWLALDPGDTTEEYGEVWTVALAWSGGFRLVTSRGLTDVSIAGGAGHDGAPARRLAPGEQWSSPAMVGTYGADGFGEASRRLHRYVRGHVVPHPDELPPVLYNTWEATYFDVREPDQMELAAVAASLGVELFVIDDGWFGQRDDDSRGLGDWWPHATKFPAGLGPLSAEVHRLGLRFGLWVEPEMVNPDSALYRAHPDWVLHMADRTRTELRRQLVLNFARGDVVAWASAWLDDLVRVNDVDFLKWDMNRPFTEAGWPGADDPGRLWSEHTEGVYAVIDRLRAAHPRLRIEACASGGGRADLGIMRRTDQIWTSDNTDPVDRLPIHTGFSQIYPAALMGAWVTESPNPITGRATPLRFRFHVAMCGALGLSGDIRTWSAQEQREAAAFIRTYQRIRPLIAYGDQYRLRHGAVTAVEYAATDRSAAILFVWRPAARHGAAVPPLRLRGLDPAATYRTDDGSRHTGAVLAAYGLDVAARLPGGDYSSALIHLVREVRG
jgi:alpha-galactosidase